MKDYFRGCRQFDLPLNEVLETRFKTIVQSYLYEAFARHPFRYSNQELTLYRWHAEQYGLHVPEPKSSQALWDLYGLFKNNRAMKFAFSCTKLLAVLTIGSYAASLAAFNQNQFWLAVPTDCLVTIVTNYEIQNYQDGLTRAGPMLLEPWGIIGASTFVLAGTAVSIASWLHTPARDFYGYGRLNLPRGDEDAGVPSDFWEVEDILQLVNGGWHLAYRPAILQQARTLRAHFEGLAREQGVKRLTQLNDGTINLVQRMLKVMDRNLRLDSHKPVEGRQELMNLRNILHNHIPDTRAASVALRSDRTLPHQLQELSDFIERAFNTDHYVPAAHSVIYVAKRIRNYLTIQKSYEDSKDIEMQAIPTAYQPHPNTKILIQQLVHLMSFYQLSPTYRLAGGNQLKEDLIRLVPGVRNKYASSWLLQARVALYTDYPLRGLLTSGLLVAMYQIATSSVMGGLQNFRPVGKFNDTISLDTYNKIYAYQLGNGPSGTPGCCISDNHYDADQNRRVNMVCPPLDEHYKNADFYLHYPQLYTQTSLETAIYSLPFLVILWNLFYMLMG